MKGTSRIEFANTLRGVAALAVLISHYYGVFWSSRAAVEALTNAPALPLETHATPQYISWLHIVPIFNWGAYGVALFFLISGFVIPFSLQRMSCVGFLINRILRILPTYLMGFSVTLLAILMSSKYFSREWPFSTREVLIHYIPGIRDIMWSRVIDGIVWTLEIEMKFYLLCALLISLFRQRSLKVFLAPVMLFFLALWLNRMIPVWINKNASAWQLAITYSTVSQYIIYMFIGVIFHYLYLEKIDANRAYLGIGGLFAMFCIHWWAGPHTTNFEVAWSYAFALLTFAFAYSFPNVFKSNRIFDFFADISYPLYVIHGVAGYVALRVMLDMGVKAWVSLLIVTFTCIFLSWWLHVLIESPTQKLGKQLAAKLTRTHVNPAPVVQQG
jgi:peptidoglycan/LPS O-acetylase OafA/YrhL